MLTMRLDVLYDSYSSNGRAIGVQLTAAGNSAVKVVVTNNGDMALNLLRRANLFDEKLPVERISMFASNSCKFYLDLPNPTRLKTNYY